MGNKSSSRPAAGAEEDHLDQNATITRAISRGKLYISIRHPKSVENVSQKFEDQSYRQILSALQQVSWILYIFSNVLSKLYPIANIVSDTKHQVTSWWSLILLYKVIAEL